MEQSSLMRPHVKNKRGTCTHCALFQGRGPTAPPADT